MKKKFIVLTAFVIAVLLSLPLQAFAGYSFSEDEAEKLEHISDYFSCSGVGDADLNGTVQAADARLILRYSLRLDELTGEQKLRADVDRSGTIDQEDARLALRIAVGLEEQPEHTTESITVIPATCKTGGYTIKICVTCGKIYSESKTSPDDHVPGLWVTTKKADCLNKGEAQLKCILCGEVIQTKEVPEGEHAWGEWEYPDGKSCLDPVKRTRTCSVCGNKEESTLNPTGHHDFGWIATVPATCTEDGVLTYGCVNCGYITDQTQILPAKGHSASEWTVIKTATCAEAGIRARICDNCGENITEEEVPATGHSFDNRHKKITLEPTCSEEGKADVICSKCGERQEISVEKAPHTLVKDWETVKEATCSGDGLKVAECKFCGTLSEVIPALDHTPAWQHTTKATCSAEGLDSRVCKVCSAVLETKTLEKLPHTLGGLTVETEPTCSDTGTGFRTCKVCGEKVTEEIAATGIHVAGTETVITKEADCLNNAVESAKCIYCGEAVTGTEKEVPETALGHDIENYVTVQQATCTVKGVLSGKCARCGEQEEKATEPLGHTEAGKWTTASAPTCSKEGISVLKCDRCNEILRSEYISTIPHAYEAAVIGDITDTDEVKLSQKCSECGSKAAEPFVRIRVLGGKFSFNFSATEDFMDGTVKFTCDNEEMASKIAGITVLYGKYAEELEVSFDGTEYSFVIPAEVTDSETIRLAVTEK